MVQTLVLVGYGRIVVGSGPADEYVAIAKRALTLIPGTEDRVVTLNGILSQACLFAGLLNEALVANDQALAVAPRIEKAERYILGFDIEHWIQCLHGRILVLLGRFAEARDWLERLLSPAGEQINPVVHFIPHVALVELAWSRGDPALAAKHASLVGAMAEHSAIPYLRVIAMTCAGLAESTAGKYVEAVEKLVHAIEFARRTKAGLEYEPRMVADLADAYLRTGDTAKAAVVAEEAIELSRRRTARAAECHASIIRAEALAIEGTPDPELLDRAEELLRISGAMIYDPLFVRARDRLTSVSNRQLSTGPAA